MTTLDYLYYLLKWAALLPGDDMFVREQGRTYTKFYAGQVWRGMR